MEVNILDNIMEYKGYWARIRYSFEGALNFNLSE